MQAKMKGITYLRRSSDSFALLPMLVACFSAAVLGLLVNWLSAALLAFTIFFYVVVYTVWLKRSTPQNIVIGGAAGALPPVIGWAASAGSISLEPVLLFLIVFVWTPPHFWALALTRVEEYARAGVPMLPVVAGRKETKRQILLYSAVLALAGTSPWLLGYRSAIYGVTAILAGALMVLLAARLFREREGERKGVGAQRAALRLFGFSIVYLFMLFAVLLVDAVAGRFF